MSTKDLIPYSDTHKPPAGRSRMAGKHKRQVEKIMRDAVPEAAAKLVFLMRHGNDQRLQYEAAVYLMNRVFGRPKQEMDLTSDGKPVTVNVNILTKTATVSIPPVIQAALEAFDDDEDDADD